MGELRQDGDHMDHTVSLRYPFVKACINWRHLHHHSVAIFSMAYTVTPDLKFVATVATGGRVKIVPTVYIFHENNAFPCKICI